jgi:Polyketide cyclase / dehydrase and lipid transport
MMNRFGIGLASAVCVLAAAASLSHTQASTQAAQTPPAAPVWPVGVGPGSAASPTYVSIPMEIAVNKPAAEVWKRVGKFCDIAEWLRIPTCTITAGKDGEFGAVRSVAGEVLVAKTELSYTYTQTPAFQAGGRGGPRPYNLYHGTLEARPVTATTSKLVYTLFFDNSMLADDAARERDREQKTAQFTTALQNMKILAEGGTLPPAPARGTGAPPAGGTPGRGN